MPEEIWRKSSYSADSGACIVVQDTPTTEKVRDSKNMNAAELEFPWSAWAEFIRPVQRK